MVENISDRVKDSGQFSFLTNLSIAQVCQLSTDPRALKSLTDVVPQSVIFHIPGLHAKVYIADSRAAIVTSGNLTASGLYRNLEYGVEISDRSVARRIRDEIVDFAQLGAIVPHIHLAAYCEALEQFHVPIEREHHLARQALQQALRTALSPIEDGLLRLRLASGAVHTVFARTIEYLLRTHGALTTIEIHPLISAIHPDLCDDSIDRVIDGKRFGKKWKHAVRTAQQQLKKMGRIEYANGRWSLR